MRRRDLESIVQRPAARTRVVERETLAGPVGISGREQELAGLELGVGCWAWFPGLGSGQRLGVVVDGGVGVGGCVAPGGEDEAFSEGEAPAEQLGYEAQEEAHGEEHNCDRQDGCYAEMVGVRPCVWLPSL